MRAGVPLEVLGVGRGRSGRAGAREVWRLLCGAGTSFRGTAVALLARVRAGRAVRGRARLSAETADADLRPDRGCLRDDAYRPRALFERFGVEVLATTDDPADDLAAHAALAADPAWRGTGDARRSVRTVTSSRTAPAGATRSTARRRLAGVDTGDYAGYVLALEERRRDFLAHGATSPPTTATSTSHRSARAARCGTDLPGSARGEATAAEAAAFRRHMLLEMARMSAEDGLVMTAPPRRCAAATTAPTSTRSGPTPGTTSRSRSSSPVPSARCSTASGRSRASIWSLFTLDETAFSREIAPLAGFYPSVYIGAPWWFLDAPEAIRRFRAAVGETAGFSRTSGFVDDTRAFCSIPARHDMSRRHRCRLPRRLVAEHRLGEDEAADTAVDLGLHEPPTDLQAVTAPGTRLARSPAGPAAHEVRIVHLGLGNFFRAHQAWYTERAPDAKEWGIAAFTGRSRRTHRRPRAQEGLYTLVTRGRGGDGFEWSEAFPACTPRTTTRPGSDTRPKPDGSRP